jgi:hypothetical protein
MQSRPLFFLNLFLLLGFFDLPREIQQIKQIQTRGRDAQTTAIISLRAMGILDASASIVRP